MALDSGQGVELTAQVREDLGLIPTNFLTYPEWMQYDNLGAEVQYYKIIDTPYDLLSDFKNLQKV